MQENGASSSVPEVPTCRSLEMPSSCRGSEVEVGKMQCRSSGSDGKALAEAETARHGGDPGYAQMAEASQGKGVVQIDLTRRSSDGNGEMGLPARCSACGLEMQTVHRMKRDGAFRLYCTSCVLYHYQGMYCCQCFHVYPDAGQLGDPSLWLTCSKCQRFCHMECAQNHGLPTNSFFFACQYCYRDPENQPANSTLKRWRMDDSLVESLSLSDQETLAAAQIVALLAAKEAKDAKVRARACAAVAAKAAKLAKSALDVAYRAGLEEMRWRHEASRQNYVAAAPMNQTLRKVQMGPYIGNVRTQQITTGLDDKLRQKTFMAPYQRDAGKSIVNVNCDPDGSKAAATNLSHHQRRVLPPVVSPDVSGARFMPSHYIRKPPPQQPFSQKESQLNCASIGSGQHGSGSLSSLPNEQRFVNVSENHTVDASPESILEGSALLGTPTADTATHCATPGLARNLLHDTAVVEIISDEEAIDDFVYVGDLLTENFEKEGDVSSSLVDLTQNPSVLSSQEGTVVVERSVETSSGCKNGVASVMQNHHLVATSEVATHTGQPTLAVSSQSGTPLVCTHPKRSENAANPVSQ